MKKKKVNLRDLKPGSDGQHSNDDGHNHSSPKKVSNIETYLPAIFSFVMLIVGITVDYFEVFHAHKCYLKD